MKKLICIIIFLFTVQAYARLESNLVAHYKMNDAAESNDVVESGGNYGGFFTGTGEGGDLGDATAIARWNVVAYQTIDTDINVGVVAFHANPNGIDNVTFTINGGGAIVVSSAASNSRTGATEYFTMVDVSEYADGLITLTAVANPNVGLARNVGNMFLWNSDANTFDPNTIYVATTGNDTTGDGTTGNPYATIMKALVHPTIFIGGIIELKDEGTFDFAERFGATINATRYITIQAASGLTRENVIVTRTGEIGVCRPKVTKLHFKDLAIDFATITQLYPDWKSGGAHWWYENCYWTDSDGGWVPNHLEQPTYHINNAAGLNHYIINSDACDILIAFSGATLARDCTATKISGDVYASAKCVVNCTAANVNGTVHPYHSDFLQYFTPHENRIIYGLDCSAAQVGVQAIFLDDFIPTTHTDYAFIDCDFSGLTDAGGGPPVTQFHSASNHLYFENVNWSGQRFIFGTAAVDSSKFVGNNVVFDGCTLYFSDYDKYIDESPACTLLCPDAGVTFRNSIRGAE